MSYLLLDLPTLPQPINGRGFKGFAVKEITPCVEFPDDTKSFVQPWEDGKNNNYVTGPAPMDAIEQMRPYVEFGIRHLALTLDPSALERFCVEVIPAFADRP